MSTTRRLILMRHAKSDWHAGAASDHERPLNDRGRRDAPRVAGELVELGWTPEQVLSSDSTRTRETWALMRPALGPAIPVDFLHSLYHAGSAALRSAVAELAPKVRCVLALGHNPGWEEALAWLSGEPTVMPTAACALLTISAADWPHTVAEPRLWRLERILRPKEL
jgi:phosphohistidine phosphatase